MRRMFSENQIKNLAVQGVNEGIESGEVKSLPKGAILIGWFSDSNEEIWSVLANINKIVDESTLESINAFCLNQSGNNRLVKVDFVHSKLYISEVEESVSDAYLELYDLNGNKIAEW